MSLTIHSPYTTICTNCRGKVSVNLLYQCTSGHEICLKCNIKQVRCILCMKSICESPIFGCQNKKFGCSFKGTLDQVKTHMIDCVFKEVLCPFQEVGMGCNWYETHKMLLQHVKEIHSDKILIGEYFEDDMPTKRDVICTIVAHEQIFKFYIWIFAFHVDFLLKYIGPQKCALDYSYNLKIYLDNYEVFKKTTRCQGCNNIVIENGITLSSKDLEQHLAKGRVRYGVKIITNHVAVEDR